MIDCVNSGTDTYRESISEDKFCNRRSICIIIVKREETVIRGKEEFDACE
jgi:hypothetical protein